MRILICGAGHVGAFAAEALAAARHSITVIDIDPDRVREIGDRLDVAVLRADCAHAATLDEAGVGAADLLVAATDRDEVNLLAASIAKGMGARKSVARVRLDSYYDDRRFHYARHLGIDRLICPEYATSEQIAHILRNPAAIAIESFANWKIELQEFGVADRAPALGKRLVEAPFPRGARLVAVVRDGEAFAPDGQTVVRAGDKVVLVGEREVMPKAIRLFGQAKLQARDIVVMGGGPMAAWLCRALRDRAFHIRLFEPDRAIAEKLAAELDWVTVINADATSQDTFRSEYLGKADIFVAITDDDEANILGGAWAKSQGVKQALAVVQRPVYLHLLEHVGIDMAFSPRVAAMRELTQMLDDSPVLALSSLSRGALDVYRVRVTAASPLAERALREQKTPEGFIIAAVQHGGDAFVPGGDSVVHAGDTVLVVGPHRRSADLERFAAGE
ncbi:MAG: Trk system potassium transporter TrkA [Phycisphaerales bacterium JB039]